MSPANAERVASRIGVHLVSLFSRETRSRLKQPRPELDRLIVGALWILDMKVDVDLLLLGSIGPLWRSVIRRKLNADDPRAILVQYAMKLFVIRNDVAVKHCGPEGTLDSDICRVEHDYVSDQIHDKTVAA